MRFFNILFGGIFSAKPPKRVQKSNVKVTVKTKKKRVYVCKSPKKAKVKVCAKPKPKKPKMQLCKKPDDSCEGIKRLGVKPKESKPGKKICLKVKKAKCPKKRSRFKVSVCKESGDVFSRYPRKCPKFPFIPPSEAEAKRKAKKSKIVCLRMMKKKKPKSEGQSCQISTKAQGN